MSHCLPKNDLPAPSASRGENDVHALMSVKFLVVAVVAVVAVIAVDAVVAVIAVVAVSGLLNSL